MDLAAYLARIGYGGPTEPTQEALRGIHRAHATAIPFENLDIQQGLPIRLDIESLEAKLVARRRGGYCFEHNTLALHALRACGFDVMPCEARVRQGASRVAPRTHMVLVVAVGHEAWLWDTGFGGETLLEPLLLGAPAVEQGAMWYRSVADGPLHIVQMTTTGAWIDLYAFLAEAREPVDFEVGNWYTSTHPDSHFVTTLTAQQRTITGCRVLRNLTYAESSGGGEPRAREITRGELLPILADAFDLHLPAGTTFRAIDGQPGASPPMIR